MTSDGTQWGVPIAFSTKALYWNKDLFDAGRPRSRGAAEDLGGRDRDGQDHHGEDRHPRLRRSSAKTFDNTMHQFLHWVYTNNGQVIDADGNIVMNSPEVLAALEGYKVDGAVCRRRARPPTSRTRSAPSGSTARSAMIQAAVGAAFRAEEARMNWGVAPLPLGPAAKGPGTLLITDSLAVFKGSGVEEKAIEFAKYITSPEVQEQYEGAGVAGLTPLRPSPAVDKLVAEKPYWQPFIDGIAFGGPEPLFTDYKGFQNAMIAMVQSVVTGDAEPQAALDKAAAELEQYK